MGVVGIGEREIRGKTRFLRHSARRQSQAETEPVAAAAATSEAFTQSEDRRRIAVPKRGKYSCSQNVWDEKDSARRQKNTENANRRATTALFLARAPRHPP
jgi:hypothetical protein